MSASPPDGHASLQIWTPERVPLSVGLAGLGERALAYGVDLALVGCLTLAGLFIYSYRGDIEADLRNLPDWLGWALLMAALLSLLLYDVLFEVWADGQTPGKYLLRLRVVTEEGRRPDMMTSLLRNLTRLVDILPYGYGVGTLSLFVTGHRRLGDLLAGTVVIREGRGGESLLDECARLAGPEEVPAELPALSDAAWLDALRSLEAMREFPPPLADAHARHALASLGLPPERLAAIPEGRARAWLARLCRHEAERPHTLGALVAELSAGERALRAAHAAFRAAPTWDRLAALDDTLRRAASLLMRATSRGVPAPMREPLSLALMDAERARRAAQRAAQPREPWREVAPRLLHEERALIARAAASLALGLAVGAGLSLGEADSSIPRALLGDDLAAAIEAGARWTDAIESSGAFAAAALQIVFNNARVACLVFLGGLLGGAGPLLLLAYNGLHLGVTLGYASQLGVAGGLLRFMLAHGPVELFALCVAGAGGLCLGRALWRPGARARRAALRGAAPRGGALLLVALFLLALIAGVEGFVSPGRWMPAWVNAGVGAGSLWLVALWVRRAAK